MMSYKYYLIAVIIHKVPFPLLLSCCSHVFRALSSTVIGLLAPEAATVDEAATQSGADGGRDGAAFGLAYKQLKGWADIAAAGSKYLVVQVENDLRRGRLGFALSRVHAAVAAAEVCVHWLSLARCHLFLVIVATVLVGKAAVWDRATCSV